MDEHAKKALIAREQDRDRLLSLSLEELAKQSGPDQYQRMRYEREIYGWEFIRYLRIGKSHTDAAVLAQTETDDIVKKWNVRKIEQLPYNLPKLLE
jgi:hypothetical protein